MIDIHTHILPGIDDGARDVQSALAMLSAEWEQGVSEVVFTPHYYGKKRSLEQFTAQRMQAFETVKENIPNGLRVRLGAEVYMTGFNDPSDDTLCALAIEDTKCVLFEFPFHSEWPKALYERVERFISETGYTPIVAHAERYEYARKQPKALCAFADMGCMIQVNGEAFLEKSTKRFAFALLKHGLVHCLGSDAHDPQKRSPDLQQAKRAVEKKGLAEKWENAQNIMQKLLVGEKPQTAYTPLGKIFGLYF